MIVLSAEERVRFAAYCREQAEADTGLAQQMKRIRTPSMVVKVYEDAAAALLVVAKRLENTSGEKL